MKTKTCCFSGHRELYPEKIPLLEKELHKIIADCIEKGYRRFLCGGAKGFDFLAAKTLLAHQNTYPEIQLEIVFPYHYLPSMWKEIVAKANSAVAAARNCSPQGITVAKAWPVRVVPSTVSIPCRICSRYTSG